MSHITEWAIYKRADLENIRGICRGVCRGVCGDPYVGFIPVQELYLADVSFFPFFLETNTFLVVINSGDLLTLFALFLIYPTTKRMH